MGNPTQIKNVIAETAVTKYRIVKFGSADGKMVQAAAATDALIAVAGELDAAAGERLDVVTAGIADVEYGGTVARGDLLTSDANGKAVAAAPAAGVNNAVIGRAWVSGVVGDIGAVDIAPGQIQGA